MENFCIDCDIETKIKECCGQHPESGVQKELILENGDIFYACYNLSKSGLCKVYNTEEMPGKCIENYCYLINEKPLDKLLFNR